MGYFSRNRGQRDFQRSIPTHTPHCLVEKTDAYMKNSKCVYGHGKKELEKMIWFTMISGKTSIKSTAIKFFWMGP